MIRPLASKTATLLVLLIAIALGPVRSGAAENVNEAIELLRKTYASDRQTFVDANLQLNEATGKAFWPVYEQHQAAQKSLGDSLTKLILEYAEAYPTLSEDQARQMLERYLALEQKLASQRAAYLKKAAKILPAAKALRLAQLENRMDLALRLQLASVIPLALPSKAR